MATIKEILQNFCYRINVPAPTAFVGVASPTEQQYLSLFKYIGDNLRNRPYQWPQLKKAITFTDSSTYVDASNGQSRRYQLPGDFYRLLDSSQWDTTNQWPMRGPVSDYNMTVRTLAIVSLQTRKAFRIIGPTNYLFATVPYSKASASTIEISPIPGADDELFFGYVHCNWLWPASWVASTLYSAGAIVAGNGGLFRTNTGGTSGSTRPSGTSFSGGTTSDGAVTWYYYNEPFSLFDTNASLSDTSICLFDDDLMIEGMRWAYLRSKGLDFQQERVDWEQQVASAYARFNGPMRINTADEASEYADWPVTPEGSWPV